MAHIQLFRDGEGDPHVVINGLDITHEIYANTLRFVATGDTEFDEVALELRIAVSRLDLNAHEDVDAALLVGGALIRLADVDMGKAAV